MARSVAARRYAQAVYQLAKEKNEVEKWVDDLAVLAASVSDEAFIIFANSPKVESEKKSLVIKEAFGETVGELAVNLVSILAGRGAVAAVAARGRGARARCGTRRTTPLLATRRRRRRRRRRAPRT